MKNARSKITSTAFEDISAFGQELKESTEKLKCYSKEGEWGRTKAY